jgi:YbbR domain-containing protein
LLPNEPRANTAQDSNDIGVAVMRFFSGWRSHPLLKITGLFLALLVWVVRTFAGSEIMCEKVITNVDVSIVGLDQLRGRGYTLSDNPLESSPKVTLRVRVPWRNYLKVTGSTYAPRIDLTELKSAAGEQTISFRTSTSSEYGEVIETDPQTFTVNLENYDTRSRIPVTVVFTGSNPAMLWVSVPIADPAYVTVSGPRSLVNRVSRAEVAVSNEDLSEEREHDMKSADIVLKDALGQEIPSSLIRITSESITMNSVRVSMDVYPMIELPVDKTFAVSGTPAHGYELTSVQISPQYVRVAGPRAVINRLSAIYVDTPKDITNATEPLISGSGIRLAPELKYANVSEVIIQALIQPAKHTHSLAEVPLEVRNVDPTLRASVDPSAISVSIVGDYLDIEQMTDEQVHLFVDAANLEAGEHIVDVQCAVDNIKRYTATPAQAQVLLSLVEKQTGGGEGD